MAGIVKGLLMAMWGWMILRTWIDPSKKENPPPSGSPDTGPDGFDGW